MIEVKYVNHLGDEVILSSGDYNMLRDNSLSDYEWAPNSKNEYNTTVYSFSRSMVKKKITIDIRANTEKKYKELVDKLSAIFERDVYAVKPGKLIVNNNYYINCYIIAKTNVLFRPLSKITRCEYVLLSESGRWYKDIYRVFGNTNEQQQIETFDIDYPHDYPYDYAPSYAYNRLISDSDVPFDFEIIFQGPWENPYVIISDHIYRVFTNLEDGEYLTVNSKDKTITKTKLNGEIVNEFNLRDRDNYIFEKIIPTNGSNHVGFDEGKILSIKAFVERSDPRWI